MRRLGVIFTRLVPLAGPLMALAIGGPAGAAPPRPPSPLERTIAALRALPRLDRAAVERILGTRLEKSDGSGPFAFYTGPALRLGTVTIRTDWREPVPGRGATAGPMLNLFVASGCVSRSAIDARFGPLALTDVPRGHSLDETFVFGRGERWGRLSFGFTEREPACLASITFAAR